MKRFLRIFPVYLLALAGFGLLQQAAAPSLYYREQLGFSLMPGANSTPVSFHIVKKWDDPAKPIEAVNISKAEFMRIASGMQDSYANPDKKNLFSEHGIYDCGYFNDTIINHVIYKGGLRCNPVDDLWRLRYGEWPFYSDPMPKQRANITSAIGPGPGWARNPLKPSEGQINVLKGYGIQDVIDVIWGENAFRLLKDMQDAGWVSTYSGS